MPTAHLEANNAQQLYSATSTLINFSVVHPNVLQLFSVRAPAGRPKGAVGQPTCAVGHRLFCITSAS